MKAPKGFKYSPNGYHVVAVTEGEEMCEAAIKAAIDLKITTKAAVTKANKSKEAEAKAAKEAADAEAKAAQEAADAEAKAAQEAADLAGDGVTGD